MVDDFVGRLEYPIGKPVIAHVLPDILDRVQLGALGRDWDQRKVVGNIEVACGVPAGLIHQEDRMRPLGNEGGDFRQMKRHRLGIAKWQNEPGTLVLSGTYGPEDVC